MFAHYYVKISKQSNDISFVFRRIQNLYIQILVEKLSTSFLRNVNIFFCCEIMKYLYIKFKYNLTTTNKNNENKKFNSLNNSK